MKKAAEDEYQKLIRFISESISEAQLDLRRVERDLKDFTIENAELIGKSFNINDISNVLSPLGVVLGEKISNLVEIERYESDLKGLVESLELMKVKNINQLILFIQSVGTVGGLSSNFVFEIDQLLKTDLNRSSKEEKIIIKIDAEIKRIISLIERNKKRISKREADLENLMALDKKLSTLVADLNKKNIYYQNLENQLTKLGLQSDMSNLKSNDVYTKASVPIFPISPNKKIIVFSFALISLTLGFLWAVFYHSLNKTIFGFAQLENFSSIPNKITLTGKQVSRDIHKKFFNFPFTAQFYSDICKAGKFCCVIDLSENKKGRGIVDSFSFMVASLLAKKPSHALQRF